jgi:hypothetical protein
METLRSMPRAELFRRAIRGRRSAGRGRAEEAGQQETASLLNTPSPSGDSIADYQE